MVTRSRKGWARREKILSAAMRRVARNGARGTTLADIARDVGVSQAGVLYYFESKEALLTALLDLRDASDQFFSWRPGHEPGLAMLDRIVQVVRGWERGPDPSVGMHSMLVMENLPSDSVLHDRLLERYRGTLARVASNLRTAQASGEVRADVDADAKAVEIVAFINGLETAWLLDPTVRLAATVEQWAVGQRAAMANATSL